MDDFALSTPMLEIADKILILLERNYSFAKETKPPFTKMGLLQDFNHMDINQCQEYIKNDCPGYIDKIICSHNWYDHPSLPEHPGSSLHKNTIHKMYAKVVEPSNGNPYEHTSEHVDLKSQMGFFYQSLLGEHMFAYVSCCPNIGYVVTTLSKFSTCPTQLQ